MLGKDMDALEDTNSDFSAGRPGATVLEKANNFHPKVEKTAHARATRAHYLGDYGDGRSSTQDPSPPMEMTGIMGWSSGKSWKTASYGPSLTAKDKLPFGS